MSKQQQMESRRVLAGLVSSVVSQIVPLLLFYLSNNLSPLASHPPPSSLLPLILHFITSSELAASISLISNPSPLLPSKKRKRHPSSPPFPSSSSSSSSASPPSSASSILHTSNPDSFKLSFKMTSSTFEWLAGLLEPLLECRDPVGSSLNLSAGIRLGIGLFRLSTGSGYPEISRRFGVSDATSRFCTKQLCRVLCMNFRFWVSFPNELEPVSAGFETLTGFRNCCGVIDCARFEVRSDGDNDSYENGRGGSMVAAQIVVDSSSKILSIITGFRGDKGDSRVLKSSSLYKDVEGGILLGAPPVFLNHVAVRQYLVGDGGYPLLPWLMVPFIDPADASCEEDFNVAHHSMRQPALRTIASLRNWGILSHKIDEEIKMAVACIGACSILHNVLLMREDYTALSDGTKDYSEHDQSSQYYRDSSSLEEYEIEKKAAVVRSALAARAREVRHSTHLGVQS